MDNNKALQIGRAIINIHQGVLHSYGMSDTNDKLSLRNNVLNVTLYGHTEFTYGSVFISSSWLIREGLRPWDIISDILQDLRNFDPDVEFDDLAHDDFNFLLEGDSPSRILHDMENDGKVFADMARLLSVGTAIMDKDEFC